MYFLLFILGVLRCFLFATFLSTFRCKNSLEPVEQPATVTFLHSHNIIMFENKKSPSVVFYMQQGSFPIMTFDGIEGSLIPSSCEMQVSMSKVYCKK